MRPARPADLLRQPECLRLRLPDGRETPAFLHRPEETRAMPVVYLHGIQSHPGWFFASAEKLAGRGHMVYQPTRRGSGGSDTAPGHAASAEQLLDDVAAACAEAQRVAGATAVHVAGVSWGGKLAAAYAARRECDGVASLTLIAPGIAPRVDVSITTKLSIALSLLICPRRTFPIPLSDPALFTASEPVQEYIRTDPSSLRRATARFFYTSRQLDRMLARAPDGAIRSPTTLMLASRDRIVDNAATRACVERLTAGRAEVLQLPGAHTLEFEPDLRPLNDALAAAIRRGEGAESPGVS